MNRAIDLGVSLNTDNTNVLARNANAIIPSDHRLFEPNGKQLSARRYETFWLDLDKVIKTVIDNEDEAKTRELINNCRPKSKTPSLLQGTHP